VWNYSGNKNMGVSRHDGLASVSTDGQTAIYGSDGDVHLIRKVGGVIPLFLLLLF